MLPQARPPMINHLTSTLTFHQNFIAISVHSIAIIPTIPSLQQRCNVLPIASQQFSSIKVTNQTFIMKHMPVAEIEKNWRTSVAMCTCTVTSNPHGLLLSSLSSYEFQCTGTRAEYLRKSKSLLNTLERAVEQLAWCLTQQKNCHLSWNCFLRWKFVPQNLFCLTGSS